MKRARNQIYSILAKSTTFKDKRHKYPHSFTTYKAHKKQVTDPVKINAGNKTKNPNLPSKYRMQCFHKTP